MATAWNYYAEIAGPANKITTELNCPDLPAKKAQKKGRRFKNLLPWSSKLKKMQDQTQPVGFGSPAILQAPLPGPDGNSS